MPLATVRPQQNHQTMRRIFDSSLASDESSEDEANAGECSSPETYFWMGIVGGQMRERIAHKLSVIEDMMRVHKTNFDDESLT